MTQRELSHWLKPWGCMKSEREGETQPPWGCPSAEVERGYSIQKEVAGTQEQCPFEIIHFYWTEFMLYIMQEFPLNQVNM